MAKTAVRLTHACHLKGCEGGPGEIVEVDEKLAQQWLKSLGCKLLDPKKNPQDKADLDEFRKAQKTAPAN